MEMSLFQNSTITDCKLVISQRNLIIKDDIALVEINEEIASLLAEREAKKKEVEEITRKLEALQRKRETLCS